ncbi:hypothetical protein ES705_15551 [subsurface metagenome]
MSVIAIPIVLIDKLGNEGAEAFTEIIKEIDLEARKEAITIAEERFEKRLAEEMGKVKTEIANLRAEVRTEIGQIAVFSGILFAMLKLYFQS